jgi:small nuclear ribonucleoprotein
MSGRPFDLLSAAIGKDVIVECKGNVSYRGTLKAFDVHMNVVLENAEKFENSEPKNKYGKLLIRGENVMLISP